MSEVQNKIRSAAAKNKELLAVLAETDYAPPALAQQKKYIADLEQELQKLNQEIKKLETTREQELKSHEKYRDSVMKRYAYKMTRRTEKFDARAEKEEKEYFQALQDEHKAKEARKSTETTLAEAQKSRTELESAASRHSGAQKELDNLYDSIFEGPTPGFPEEDEKEQAAETALSNYHNTRMQLESEEQAIRILLKAGQKMDGALQSMDQARSHSRMDMFGGGTINDMMERNAIQQADSLQMEAGMLVMQAQRMSPHVQPLPKATLAKGNLMGDVFFDNIFSDMEFHEKIKQGQIELQQSAKSLHQQALAAEKRHSSLTQKLGDESRMLEDGRIALQRTREQAFERSATGQS